MLILFLLVFLALPALGDEQVEKIFAKARQVNSTLRDYKADIALQVDANLGFIPYRPRLNGQYLYQKPDKHRLELQNAPAFLQKYPQVFGFNLPKLERYNSKVIEEGTVRGRPVYRLELIPKEPTGDIQRLELFVDKENFTVLKYDTFYKQGHLLVDVDMRNQDGFWVFDKMKADFRFPSVTAKASARYSNYLFNQGITLDAE